MAEIEIVVKRSIGTWLLERPVITFSLVAVAVLLPWRPELVTAYNIETLLLSTALLAVLAIGQGVVMISGGIDLSIPAVISASSVAGMILIADSGPWHGQPWSVAAALAVMIALGAAIGTMQGVAVAYLHMPPFLVSLSTLMFLGGATLWATQSARYAAPLEFTQLWYARPFGVPFVLPLVAVWALSVDAALRRTVHGRRLYAVGQSRVVARIAGLPVERTITGAYAFSGACAALAGALYTARLYTGSPELVENEVLLDCIAAAVIGGVSLFGGKGGVPGIVAGAGFVALLGNGLNLLGLRYWHALIVKGVVILLAVAMDALAAYCRSPSVVSR